MNPMIKWIGGATAALVLAFGAATVAGQWMDSETDAGADQVAPTLDEVMPADETAISVDPALIASADGSDQAQPEAAQGEATMQQAVATEEDTAEAQPAPNNEDFVVKRILPIEGAIRYGEWHWDEEDVPDGPIVMTVDLDARVISVFRGGYEIGAAAVLLGTQEHPTPLGTFPITRKQRHNVSEKYNNAPMPYSMFLTSDGVAIHGSEVENGFASHGCIGTPDEFAAKLFAVASRGDKVIITRGQTMDMGDSIL